MTAQRDPHLPPPEVCDWLLAQEWSEPATVNVSSVAGDSEMYDHCQTTAELGRDECIDLMLPVEALQVLREDAATRREAIESKRRELMPDELARKAARRKEAELVPPGDETTRESDPAAFLAAAVAELEAKEAERLKRVTLEEFEVASTSFKLRRQKLAPAELASNSIVSTERTDPETTLLRQVLADAEQAEISAFSAIGVLTTAATMMVSQCYDLTKLGDDHTDA